MKVEKRLSKASGKWEPKQLQLDKHRISKTKKETRRMEFIKARRKWTKLVRLPEEQHAGSFYFWSCFSFGWESISNMHYSWRQWWMGGLVKRWREQSQGRLVSVSFTLLARKNVFCLRTLCVSLYLILSFNWADSYNVLPIPHHNNVIELWAETSPNQQWPKPFHGIVWVLGDWHCIYIYTHWLVAQW